MVSSKTSFANQMPEELLRQPITDILRLLELQLGSRLYEVFDPNVRIEGPFAGHTDSSWMKKANTVGINVRTIGHFWNIVPYTLTLPSAQNAIHILPFWEPGVVSSLYGPSSWNINPEWAPSPRPRAALAPWCSRWRESAP